MGDRLVTFLLGLASIFLKLAFDLGRQTGRIELTEEQLRIAEAMRADFDAIANDNRTVDDALAKLRARGGVRNEPSGDGRLP